MHQTNIYQTNTALGFKIINIGIGQGVWGKCSLKLLLSCINANLNQQTLCVETNKCMKMKLYKLQPGPGEDCPENYRSARAWGWGLLLGLVIYCTLICGFPII